MVNGQDNVTFLDSTTYDVKITKEDYLNIYFYVLSDSAKTIKKVPKKQMLDHKREAANNKQLKFISVGDELILARKRWYIGLKTQIAGGAIVLLSTQLSSTEQQAVSIIGGLIGFAGFIFMIESWSHIGRAGEQLNNNAISFGLKGNGVSMAYRF